MVVTLGLEDRPGLETELLLAGFAGAPTSRWGRLPLSFFCGVFSACSVRYVTPSRQTVDDLRRLNSTKKSTRGSLTVPEVWCLAACCCAFKVFREGQRKEGWAGVTTCTRREQRLADAYDGRDRVVAVDVRNEADAP